jgi:hypothetical protein
MNFISHFRGAMDRMAQDNRPLTAHHVALYQALFYYWNLSRFRVPMPVARNDVMNRARIGSTNTYHRCIQELGQWGYLRYEPTHNTQSRTMVHMYRFDRGSDTTGDTTTDTTGDTTRGTSGDTTTVQVAIQPLLNSIINDKNEINHLNKINDYEHTRENSNQFDDRQQPDKKKNSAGGDPGRQSGDGNHTEKTGNKGGRAAGGPGNIGGVPGSLEEVEAYFAKEKFGSEQAQRFFNYYSNLGWRIGKSERLMEDWRFAAKNWMFNVKRFDHEPELKPGALHIPPDRDYQQPL